MKWKRILIMLNNWRPRYSELRGILFKLSNDNQPYQNIDFKADKS
jgi:hypothetical protein